MNQKGFAPIILFILIATAVVLGLFFSRNFGNNLTKVQPSGLEDSKYKIAYRIGGDFVTSGDLWVMNPDGTGKKQITKVGDIDTVYAWSPDNRMILVSQSRLAKNATEGILKVDHDLSIVDVSTGKLKILKKPECFEDYYYWTSDNNILAVEPSCSDTTRSKVEMISTIGESKTLLTFPSDIPEIDESFSSSSIRLVLSPDLTWLAFDKKPHYGEPEFDPKLFVYNMKDKTKKLLQENATLLGWHKDKIMFPKAANEIWEISPDGTGLSKLFEDNSPIKDATSLGTVSQVRSSRDGNYLLYGRNVGWLEFYWYDVRAKTSRMIFKQVFNDPPGYFSISPDNSFVVYTQRFGHDETKDPIVCYTIPTKSGQPIKTTDAPCFYPVISN